MAGSATMSVMLAYAFASPTSSVRASSAAEAAFFLFGLQTPRTSASRTAWKRLDVKARVEAAADEADTERGGGHERLSGGRTGVRGGLEDARMPPF